MKKTEISQKSNGQKPQELPQKQKCLRVAFTGLPNAGKSTLINNLVGEKISITTAKPQTTRDILRGVVTEGDTQLVIIDTPGIFIPQKNRLLERKIVKNAWRGVEEAEVICMVIDSSRGIDEALKTTITDVVKKQSRIIFILNKVDLLVKPKLLELAEKLAQFQPNFEQIFMVSALNGENVDRLKKYLLSIAPEAPWLFEKDDLSSAPLRYLVAEITREKLFNILRNDLPYAVEVITDSWEDLANGSLRIRQTIHVLKDSQRAIVLGKAGTNLKQIGILARKDMENFLGRRVHLFLFVKVNADWIKNG